jgi:hypothetical protein
MGDFWGSGSGKHGVVIECKGWCTLKPNKRKRWNYTPACNCFDGRERTSFIYNGNDVNLEVIEEICDNVEKWFNKEHNG